MNIATNWVRVCALDELPPLGARVLLVEGQEPIALFRTADNKVFALRDSCPHKGGPLSQGIVSGETVACPLHSWNIRLEDGHACTPDVGFTPCYRVKVEDAAVWIEPVAAAQQQVQPA